MKHIENPALIKSANDYKDDYFILLSANGDVNAQTKNLNFGGAISYLKTGYCVAREGWNGKGMFLTCCLAM